MVDTTAFYALKIDDPVVVDADLLVLTLLKGERDDL
jgi:hypothetical protein